MKHITQTLLVLVTLFLFTACEKEDPLAACKADPTCEYFRCKVDGKEWRPDCESAFLGCDAVDVQYYRDLNGGGLELNASSEMNSNGLYFFLKEIKDEEIYYSFDVGSTISSRYFETKNNVKERFFVNFSFENYINFSTIDTINFILEGTFQFTGNTDNGEAKEITNGEFRQRYRF